MNLIKKLVNLVTNDEEPKPPIPPDPIHTVYTDEEREVERMDDEGGPASTSKGWYE